MSVSVSVIGVGFTLGLMHALDADHVMAVSTLSNERPGFWRVLRFSAHWALGHGGVLITSGLLLFGLGLAIPQALQQTAEMGVGLLLIVLGVLCFWRFHRERIQLSKHQHGDMVHIHWHYSNHHRSQKTGHAPVMVGMLHGLAGSAPALALVPAVAGGKLFESLVYLVIFSIGVMISMLFFATGFGVLQKKMAEHYARFFQWQRYLIASTAILFGGFWLSQAV